ncbi:MAG: SRPBCC family protein [Alphaproteobacteria bacterium]|jgi:hypothetical protein
MTDVSRSVTLSAPALEVWSLIGPFDALTSWHPAVLDSSLGADDGRMVRHLVFVGGIKVTERLIAHDDETMMQRYGISDGGRLPVADFTATLRVVAGSSETCSVTWSCSFQPAGAPESVVREAVEGIFDSGMNSLSDRFGKAG